MRVEAKVCLTKQQEVLAVVCEKTGIASAMVIADLAGKKEVLTWHHPFAYWSNVEGLIKDRSWLEKVDNQVLAGLFITCYSHYDLLDLEGLNAVEGNAVLKTASSETLISLVYQARVFNKKNTSGVGMLSVDWPAMKDSASAEGLLKGYLKRITPYFNRPEEGNKKQDRLFAMSIEAREGRILAGGEYLSGKRTLSDHEREFEANLRSNRAEGRVLVEDMRARQIISDKQKGILESTLKGRGLVNLPDEKRADIAEKLIAMNDKGAARFAEILKASVNPYDIFHRGVESLDSVSEEFRKDNKPVSIADILAERKRKAAIKAEIMAASRELDTDTDADMDNDIIQGEGDDE